MFQYFTPYSSDGFPETARSRIINAILCIFLGIMSLDDLFYTVFDINITIKLKIVKVISHRIIINTEVKLVAIL